jgi:two-component system sensor histidine kinase DegS
MKEIGLLVEQSQGEVEKLVQRNASITAHVHQLQAHFDTVPREDIRGAYEASQDAQQRLFTMRGQLEKLQSDQGHLKRHAETLARTLQVLEGGVSLELSEAEVSLPSSSIEQIIEAQEEERRKISRQIHDGPAQALANFILQTEIAMRLFDVDADKAGGIVQPQGPATQPSPTRTSPDLRPMMLTTWPDPDTRRYVDAREKTIECHAGDHRHRAQARAAPASWCSRIQELQYSRHAGHPVKVT